MQPAPPAQRTDNLALLYQSILTAVARIQSGRQPLDDIEVFRRRMKSALQDVERESSVAGYSTGDTRDAEFAVAALLDETILSSKDAKADEWRKRPLIIELFGQAIAGDVFFDKLVEIERRRDSTRLADLLEVYLLCLLLGFKGRFGPPLRDEAYRIMERLRSRIETIRGIDYKLSPPMEFKVEAAPMQRSAFAQSRWWIIGAAALVLLFAIYRVSLWFQLDRLRAAVLSLK